MDTSVVDKNKEIVLETVVHRSEMLLSRRRVGQLQLESNWGTIFYLAGAVIALAFAAYFHYSNS